MDDLIEAQKIRDEEIVLLKSTQTEIEPKLEFEDPGVFCCNCECYYEYEQITLKTGRFYCPQGHNIGK